MNENKVWRLHCQMWDESSVDIIPPEWMETPTEEEIAEAIKLLNGRKERNRILDKQYKFVEQLEKDLANLCMEFEKTTGAYISGLNFNRQMKHVWYGTCVEDEQKGNPKIVRVHVLASSEYLITPYDWEKDE